MLFSLAHLNYLFYLIRKHECSKKILSQIEFSAAYQIKIRDILRKLDDSFSQFIYLSES